MKNNIRNLREEAELTQSEVAKYLQVHQTTYSDYELGNLNVSIPLLLKLADFYHTSVDYLLGRTDEREPYPPKKRKNG